MTTFNRITSFLKGAGHAWFLVSVILLVTVGGCLDEIDLVSDNPNEQNIVIQGKLTMGDPALVTVQVSRLSEFRQFDQPAPLAVVEIRLLDEDDNAIRLVATGEGQYQQVIPAGDSRIEIRPGKSYRLLVQTMEGETIISDAEPLLAVPPTDSVSIEVIERLELNEIENEVVTKFVRFKTSGPLTIDGSSRARLKWELENVYRADEMLNPDPFAPSPKTCYVAEILNRDKIIVFDGNESNTGQLREFLLNEQELGRRFSRGYYLLVYQESLSEGAYQYWDQVSRVVDRNGNFFEAPPGEIDSNFTNLDQPGQKVLGYFYAVERDTFRRYISPMELDFPPNECTFASSYEDAPASCRNCLIWPNSTIVKPAYWIQ